MEIENGRTDPIKIDENIEESYAESHQNGCYQIFKTKYDDIPCNKSFESQDEGDSPRKISNTEMKIGF